LMRSLDDAARERECRAIKFQALPRFPAFEAFLQQNQDRLIRRTRCTMWTLPTGGRVLGTAGTDPSSFVVAPLRAEDADVVNRTWKYNRGAQSLPLVRSMIASGRTMAAFVDDSDSGKRRPVSWALEYPNGSWGMLHTLESHRRRGLALRVVRSLMRHLRDGDDDRRVFNYVVEGNDASVRLCTKVGLRKGESAVDWVFLRAGGGFEASESSTKKEEDRRVRFALWNVAAKDANVPPTVKQSGGPSGFDIVLLVFVLSAIHPRDHVRALSRIRTVCRRQRESCRLCFRDYGLYDMTMLRSKPCEIVADETRLGDGKGIVSTQAPRLFRRADGTLRYFFDIQTMERTFRRAGWVLERGRTYCCVINRNRKSGKVMRRIFVNAVFRPA